MENNELYEKDYYYSTASYDLDYGLRDGRGGDTLVVCEAAPGGFPGVPYCVLCGRCFTCFGVRGNSERLPDARPEPCGTPDYAHVWNRDTNFRKSTIDTGGTEVRT